MTVTHRNRRSSMKLAALATMTLSLFALAVLTGCEQPTDPKKEDDKNSLPAGLTQSTATAATAENIVGAWKTTTTGGGSSITTGEYTSTSEQTQTIKADGTFSKFVKRTNVSKTDANNIWYEYRAEKGTFTLVDNLLTQNKTNSYYSDTLFDPVNLTEQQWNASLNTNAQTIAILDGKLCMGAYQRKEAGTGLVGSWENYYMETYTNNSIPVTTYRKGKYVFTPTEMTHYSYQSESSTFGEPKDSQQYGYTLPGNNTLAVTVNGTIIESVPFLVSTDWLYFGSGYTKVTP